MEAWKTALWIEMGEPYEQVLSRVISAAKAEGFGVLNQLDLHALLKEKLGVDFRRYTILSVCNPQLAYRALTADSAIGLLLPCKILVYEENGKTRVAIVDPMVQLVAAENPELAIVAEAAQARLKQVAAALRH